MNNDNNNQDNNIYKDLVVPSDNNLVNNQSNNYINQNLESPNNVDNSLNKNLTNTNTILVGNNIQSTNSIPISLNNTNNSSNEINVNNIDNKIQNQNNSNDNIIDNNEHKVKKQVSAKNIVLVVLSIINILTIFPYVLLFSFLILLFGRLSVSESELNLTLIKCGIYEILSIVIFFKSIWNLVKCNNVLKTIFKISILVVTALIVGPIIYIYIMRRG